MIGILALIVPGIVISIMTANNTAQVACGLVVAEEAPDSVSYEPRFELMGVDGPGWYCYARGFDGTEIDAAGARAHPRGALGSRGPRSVRLEVRRRRRTSR